MNRFILLAFAFLGLVFYELSGGADFDPEAAREAAMLARAERDGTDPAKVEAVLAAGAEAHSAEPIETTSSEPVVTRASLNLVTVDEVLSDPDPVSSIPTPAPGETITLQSLEASEPDLTSLERPEIVLPSIAFAGNTLQVSSGAVSLPRDIRFVAGASVNMRAGPGTEHAVVTQLERDTQVEVLQDSGTGWVQLRPVTGGPTGWVADFLLTGS